jgi:hypothetical protein
MRMFFNQPEKTMDAYHPAAEAVRTTQITQLPSEYGDFEQKVLSAMKQLKANATLTDAVNAARLHDFAAEEDTPLCRLILSLHNLFGDKVHDPKLSQWPESLYRAALYHEQKRRENLA